jgi:predicted transcriptional regulator YdeE
MAVRVNMNDGSMKECPALWEKFVPKVACMDALNEEFMYGVSTDMEENGDMRYWAVVESAAQAPEGMGAVELEAREYALCPIETIEEIGPAFLYLYGDWAKTQAHHKVDFTKPCFELYHQVAPSPSESSSGYEMTIYVPLVYVQTNG